MAVHHDAQQHAPRLNLGAALLALEDADLHIPHPWRTAFLRQFAGADGRLALHGVCRQGRRWVLDTSDHVTCTPNLDLATDPLFRALAAVEQCILTRGRLSTAVRLQQEQENDFNLLTAVGVLKQFSISHLSMNTTVSKSGSLHLVLRSFQQLTHLHMDANLTDDLMPVLLQHAAQLKHLSVAKVTLTKAAPTNSTCSWVGVTMRDAGSAEPTCASLLSYLPPCTGKLCVTLPEGAPAVSFRVPGDTGLSNSLVQRVQQLSFSNLQNVLLSPPSSGFTPTALENSLEHVAFMQASCKRLSVSTFKLNDGLWEQLCAPVAAAWQELAVQNVSQFDVSVPLTAKNLVSLDGYYLTVNDTICKALRRHAPGLKRLCVWGVPLVSGEHASATWGVDCVVLTAATSSLQVSSIGRWPQTASGKLTVEANNMQLQFTDITPQGLPAAVAARMPTCEIQGHTSIHLSLAPSVPPSEQHTALHTATQQLSQLLSSQPKVTLHGLNMTQEVADFITSGTDNKLWSEVKLTELQWPPSVVTSQPLPSISQLQLNQPLCDDLLATLLQCAPVVGTVVFSKGVKLEQCDATEHLTWGTVQVHDTEMGLTSLVRLPVGGVNKPNFHNCTLVCSVTESQADEVCAAATLHGTDAFSFQECKVIIRPPRTLHWHDQKKAFEYHARTLKSVLPSIPRGVEDVVLSQWQFDPSMTSMLPDALEVGTCDLILSDDVIWPSDAATLKSSPIPSTIPIKYQRWHFPTNCSDDCLAAVMCWALRVPVKFPGGDGLVVYATERDATRRDAILKKVQTDAPKRLNQAVLRT